MVPANSYLYLSRHNIYYFRAIIPTKLHGGGKNREYRKSLQTLSSCSQKDEQGITCLIRAVL